jgi:methionine-S-sulfoxide reductase
VRTRVGYAGGTKDAPTYRSLGDHTETFQVDFDPSRLPYGKLLDVFWSEHDPRSAPMCTQYAAVLFVHDDAQERAARESRARLEAALGAKVKTVIRRLDRFWNAEDYHQKHSLRHQGPLLGLLRPFVTDEASLRESPLAAKLNAFAAGDLGFDRLRAQCADLGYEVEGNDGPEAIRIVAPAVAAAR